MSYEELTPMVRDRYDEYMDQSSEQPAQEAEQEEQVGPGPVTPEGRSLLRNAKNGTESGEAPTLANKSPEQGAAEGAQKSRATREALVEISRDIFKTTNPGDIRSMYAQVRGWGLILNKYLPKDQEGRPEDFWPVWEEIEGINKRMGAPSDDRQPNKEDTAHRDRVLAERANIASVAQKMKNYFEKEKLILSEDQFRQINSFEELMAKVADITEKDDYKPGGKYQLIEVTNVADEYGRLLVKEKAHPENFLRWMREQMWFYHDFSPTSQIKLFEEIYIPTAYRTISLGEILYGGAAGAYFTHRVPRMGDVSVSDKELLNAEKNGLAILKRHADGSIESAEYRDKATGEVVGRVGRDSFLFSDRDGTSYFKVLDKHGEAAQGVLRDKESWNTQKDDSFDQVKSDALYEAWIMTFFHNYDVEYRLKGMASEKPLNEVMADICGINMMTQDRDRLLRLFRMQSTEKKGEAQERLASGPSEQGSVGKAMQRSLAGYYHNAEASARVKGFGLDDGFNAFTEVMKGKDVDGAQEFYKSLVNQTLEKEFSERIAGMKELIDRLNNRKINARYDEVSKQFTQDDFAAETLRDRNDYEKVQLFEVAFLESSELKKLLRQRYRIQFEDFTEELQKLQSDLQNKEGYMGADGKKKAYDAAKSQQMLSQLVAMGKRREALKLLDGRHGFSSGSEYAKTFADEGIHALDLFAVKFLVQPFDTSITSSANLWENISYDQRAAKRVRLAMREAISHTEKLNEFEAKYAEEWAFTMTYFTGISARNDMNGIGHDAYSKIQNTEYYRLRQSGGGNYPGNLENLYGIHRLGLNMWEGLKVQREEKKTSNKLDTTLYEVLTGLRKDTNGKYYFDINTDVGDFDFFGNAMRQFHADHLNHAIELFSDITSKHEFNIDKLVEKDNYGRLLFKHEEMQKMIDSTWKHLRYGFDNRGFLYDNVLYEWWYDETIEYDKENKKIGQVKRTPRFGLKTLRNSMFSKEVQDMRMYDRLDLSGWSGDEAYHTKNGRNVFAYLISAQIREHTRYDRSYRKYSADEVEMITNAFVNYAARVMRGEEGETIVLSGFFSPEEIMRILVAAHAVLWIMHMEELGLGMSGGFLFGFFEALGLIMKQFGAGIKL